MDSLPRLQPSLTQHQSVPGGYETEEEASPTKSTYNDALSNYAQSRRHSLADEDRDDEEAGIYSDASQSRLDGGGSMLDEGEMSKKLMDVESSFMPEQSHIAPENHGNDTSDLATPMANLDSQSPPSFYKTPAPARRDSKSSFDTAQEVGDETNTSSLETMSSSPTAAAAARTVSRVVSLASMAGYETAEESNEHDEAVEPKGQEEDATPKRQSRLAAREESLTPTNEASYFGYGEVESSTNLPRDSSSLKSPRRRPKYLNSRHTSQRSSYSSNTTSTSAEGGSNLTIGAEYALQTGGGIPLDSAPSSRPDQALERSVSLGSLASSVSKLSDGDDVPRTGRNMDLSSLPEESTPPGSLVNADRGRNTGELQTPKNTGRSVETPTDTVINQRIQNLEVPGTIARRFRNGESNPSPERLNGFTTPATVRVKNLTLKEQSSLIDKLQKENWKLKLKLYFMDQMLTERSDESVKAMVSENVELKTSKFSSAKEIRGLKRSIRELESKVKERDERIATQSASSRNGIRSSSNYTEASQELEHEIKYLRERVETYQVDIERLRGDNAVKEGEKRRLAEMVRASGERSQGDSNIETREEVAMWKDLLETETARKGQAEEENRKLRDELWRLTVDAMSSLSTNHSYARPPKSREGYSRSEVGNDAYGASKSSSTLVEHLRQENAELRRDLGAQTSMLTSRNREKERLYQEIEDLKMGQRRDGSRSMTGDSILERSASRAHGRSASRTSSRSRVTQIADAEREVYENANGELRDQISELKLENQELATQLDRVLDELDKITANKDDFDKLQQMYDQLTEQTNEEILGMQSERDEALQLQEEAELGFQDLRAEAQERINSLEDELDQNSDAIKQLERELNDRDKESSALRDEVRMTSEGLDKVEADAQAKLRRIKELELENEDIGRELEGIENSLIEANSKYEKLVVELESRQSECAFLREEQDGCMIKIGDLDTALKTAQTSLDSEKEKTKDLETRLAEERHQREVIGSKEKQEVQKMMNNLNQEATLAKEESRKHRKLAETRETELTTWKERLTELESGLREVLGDTSGSKSSFILAITKVQNKLENTANELAATKNTLSEKERLLQRRDALLESHGLESQKLSELLDKERSARRAEKAQFDQWEKTQQHNARTMSQKDSRISELQVARQADRKKLTSLEQQFKEQLTERNTLLLNLWNKLAPLCGSDWQHQNSLINNHYPTVEVVASMLPGFSRNLLLAVKTIEGVISGFRSRVKAVERDLAKDYQQLEHNLDLRIKRLDRLESAVQVSRISGAANAAPEIAKLRGENRLLKADLSALQKAEQVRASRQNAVSIEPGPPATSGGSSESRSLKSRGKGPPPELARGYSTTAVEALQRENEGGRAVIPSQPIEPSQQRWIHRLRELERRLKAEREARLLDRNGAKKRLEEGKAENEELRQELEREKERRKGD